MKRPKRKYIFGAVLLLLLLAQLIRIDKSVPEVEASVDFLTLNNVDPVISKHIKNACYDCHSYQSKYPWYANIAPVSWWLKGHINGGRQHLNFSTWGTYSQKKQHHKMEECIEMMQNGSMPLKSFKWGHPEARLSDTEIESLISLFKQQESKLSNY